MASILPKYIQQVQMTQTKELELLIAPEGIIPVLTFLKDHTNAQYKSLADQTVVDKLGKPFRFEVQYKVNLRVKTLWARSFFFHFTQVYWSLGKLHVYLNFIVSE